MCNPLTFCPFLASGTNDQLKQRNRHDPNLPDMSRDVDDELFLNNHVSDNHVSDELFTRNIYMNIESGKLKNKGSNKSEPVTNSPIPMRRIEAEYMPRLIGYTIATDTTPDIAGSVDPNIILNDIRANNRDRIIVGHLNVNHIEKKFEPLVSLVKDKLDIAFFSETKVDSSFPLSQFLIEGYTSPFRRDRDQNGGGILLYVREDIPCKEIKFSNFPDDIECLIIEIKLRDKKYILIGGYCPHKDKAPYFLNHVGRALDKFLGNYDNILIMGDFNSTSNEQCMRDFCEIYNLENLIKEPTCFKSTENPSSIDVILTNRKESFYNSRAIETGLSDFHKMTISVLKTFVKKKEPIKINYRCYKKFDAMIFRTDLTNSLLNEENMTYEKFHEIFLRVLKLHAPTKQRTVRGNEQPFMNKVLSKAFMHRSKLKNLFNAHPTEINKLNYKR